VTTTQDEFTPAELGTAKRPEPPLQISKLFIPLAIMVAGYALAGLVGEQSLLWGLLIGAVTAGFLLWQKVVTDRIHLAAVVVSGVVGVYVFDVILSNRSTVIEKGLSLRASVGWLLFGLVVGLALSLGKRPALAPQSLVARTLATGLGFAGAAFLALQAGTAIGFIEPLRTTQIAAGAVQTLTTGFYVQFSAIVAALGGAIRRATELLQENQFDGTRRTIDISGDGRNNTRPALGAPRQHAQALGITVNGLAIESDDARLTNYYFSNVIVGAGSFVETAADYGDFAAAMLRKLVREITPPITKRHRPAGGRLLHACAACIRRGNERQIAD